MHFEYVLTFLVDIQSHGGVELDLQMAMNAARSALKN